MNTWLALSLFATISGPHQDYARGAYDQALKGFLEQQQKSPTDPDVAINLGSTYYRLEQYEKAQEAFSKAIQAQDPHVREHALYNLGNAAFRQKKLDEAQKAYEDALKINAKDEDAAFNLNVVKKVKEQQKNEQNKDQQDKQQGEQQDKQQGEQQKQSSGSSQKEQPAKEHESESDKSSQKEKQSAPQESNGKTMSPQEAQQLLQNIQEGTRRMQQVRGKGQKRHVEKDW